MAGESVVMTMPSLTSEEQAGMGLGRPSTCTTHMKQEVNCFSSAT
jgi:hypothetical protein